jgi:hypothetical protein
MKSPPAKPSQKAQDGSKMAGSHTAFFYGTLMAPTVMWRVIHGTHKPEEWEKERTTTTPALLTGYERRKVWGCDYPAITNGEGATVRGTLVKGLTDMDLMRLDIFEGSQYERKKVKVRVLPELGLDENADEKASEGDEMVDAETYVWVAREDELEPKEWDFEEFKREKLHRWAGDMDWEDGGFEDVDREVAAAAEQEAAKDPTGGRMVNGAIGKELETLHAAV